MELTRLDTDLMRLDQTVRELIALGLVEPFYDTEDTIRFRLIAEQQAAETAGNSAEIRA